MPALNFHARFANAVMALEKRQTIRVRGKRQPPKVGDSLFLYTGMRTASCRKLATVTCASVEQIMVDPDRKTVTMPRGQPGHQFWSVLDQDEVTALALADGFACSDDFFAFFADAHGCSISGYLIKW